LDAGKKELLVADIMDDNPIFLAYEEAEYETIPHDAALSEAAGIFISKQPHKLVVTKGGRKIGSVSRSDILKAVASEDRKEAQSQ
jgi:osmoprotectant transport system ATP-binding protein